MTLEELERTKAPKKSCCQPVKHEPRRPHRFIGIGEDGKAAYMILTIEGKVMLEEDYWNVSQGY